MKDIWKRVDCVVYSRDYKSKKDIAHFGKHDLRTLNSVFQGKATQSQECLRCHYSKWVSVEAGK